MLALPGEMLGFGLPYFNTFFLKEPLGNKSLYFFLPGYLKAQDVFVRMPTGGGGPAAKASNQGLEVFSKTPHPEPPNSSGFRSGGMQGFQSMCHVGVCVFFICGSRFSGGLGK